MARDPIESTTAALINDFVADLEAMASSSFWHRISSLRESFMGTATHIDSLTCSELIFIL